jgi:E3 ubiquitin-protein ligase TRIP12
MKKGASDSVLPSVMTCQNYVKMPDYSSYEVLRERFTTAVAEGASNFTLS